MIDQAVRPLIFSSVDDFPAEGTINTFYAVLSPYEHIYSDLTESAKVLKSTASDDFIYKMGHLELYKWDKKVDKDNNVIYGYVPIQDAKLQPFVTKDWRTELYMQGAEQEYLGADSNYYYTEMKNEWGKIYDFKKNQQRTDIQFQDIDFYLDFIDTNSAIGELSVSNIGRRTKVLVDDKINCLFAKEIPNVLLYEQGTVSPDSIDGTQPISMDSSLYSCIATGGQSNSAYDMMLELLYQYTNYNENIQLQCIPLYHLDVNTRITINDIKSDISGDYVIKTLSIPLDIKGTMNISAVRAVERI